MDGKMPGSFSKMETCRDPFHHPKIRDPVVNFFLVHKQKQNKTKQKKLSTMECKSFVSFFSERSVSKYATYVLSFCLAMFTVALFSIKTDNTMTEQEKKEIESVRGGYTVVVVSLLVVILMINGFSFKKYKDHLKKCSQN